MLILIILSAAFAVLVLVALIVLGPTFWAGLLIACLGLVFVMLRSARTPQQGPAKWVAIFGACAVLAVTAIFTMVSFFFGQTMAPTQAASQVQKNVDALLKKGSANPKRFSTAYAAAKTVDVLDWRRSLTREIFNAINAVEPNEALDETELDTALAAARDLRQCPALVPAAAVRRMDPSQLAQLLQAAIASGVDSCGAAQTQMLDFVSARCAHTWAGRCEAELPREALQSIANAYNPNDRMQALKKDQLESFISRMWPRAGS